MVKYIEFIFIHYKNWILIKIGIKYINNYLFIIIIINSNADYKMN